LSCAALAYHTRLSDSDIILRTSTHIPRTPFVWGKESSSHPFLDIIVQFRARDCFRLRQQNSHPLDEPHYGLSSQICTKSENHNMNLNGISITSMSPNGGQDSGPWKIRAGSAWCHPTRLSHSVFSPLSVEEARLCPIKHEVEHRFENCKCFDKSWRW
jgi:hypothetical protein